MTRELRHPPQDAPLRPILGLPQSLQNLLIAEGRHRGVNVSHEAALEGGQCVRTLACPSRAYRDAAGENGARTRFQGFQALRYSARGFAFRVV